MASAGTVIAMYTRPKAPPSLGEGQGGGEIPAGSRLWQAEWCSGAYRFGESASMLESQALAVMRSFSPVDRAIRSSPSTS